MKPIMKGSLGTLILSVLLLWPGRAFSAEDIPANCPDLVQIVSTLRADLEKRKPDSSRIQAIETQLQEYVNHREEILLSEKLMEKWAKTFQELRDSLPGPFSGTEGHPLYRLMLLRDKLDLVLKTPHFERTCGASQGLCEWKGLCWETKDKKSLKLLLDMVKGSIQQCQAYEDQTLSPLFFGIVGHQEDLMRNSVAGVEACLQSTLAQRAAGWPQAEMAAQYAACGGGGKFAREVRIRFERKLAQAKLRRLCVEYCDAYMREHPGQHVLDGINCDE